MPLPELLRPPSPLCPHPLPAPSELPLLSKAASSPNYHFPASEAPEPMHFLQDPNLIFGGNWSRGPGTQPGGFPPQLSLPLICCHTPLKGLAHLSKPRAAQQLQLCF